MEKTYYIFQKNKVVYRNNKEVPHPFDQRELDSITGRQSPLIMQEAPTEKGLITVELGENHPLPNDYELVPLRSLLGWADDSLFGKWGKASQLLHWFNSNRFCGKCGSPTEPHPTEMARVCPGCSTNHYPAISPCIIVLVYRKNEILLARACRFPIKLYSTLAGFIEPGETAEEAVEREIFEEVQIRIQNIRYFKSQPWPFPGQLMLGFFAEYLSGEINIDGHEICDAGWYTYGRLPEIPSPGTIAGQLIRHHLEKMAQENN